MHPFVVAVAAVVVVVVRHFAETLMETIVDVAIEMNKSFAMTTPAAAAAVVVVVVGCDLKMMKMTMYH